MSGFAAAFMTFIRYFIYQKSFLKKHWDTKSKQRIMWWFLKNYRSAFHIKLKKRRKIVFSSTSSTTSSIFSILHNNACRCKNITSDDSQENNINLCRCLSLSRVLYMREKKYQKFLLFAYFIIHPCMIHKQGIKYMLYIWRGEYYQFYNHPFPFYIISLLFIMPAIIYSSTTAIFNLAPHMMIWANILMFLRVY